MRTEAETNRQRFGWADTTERTRHVPIFTVPAKKAGTESPAGSMGFSRLVSRNIRESHEDNDDKAHEQRDHAQIEAAPPTDTSFTGDGGGDFSRNQNRDKG